MVGRILFAVTVTVSVREHALRPALVQLFPKLRQVREALRLLVVAVIREDIADVADQVVIRVFLSSVGVVGAIVSTRSNRSWAMRGAAAS